MVKHTQVDRQQQPTNCLSVFDHIARLALKRLTNYVPMFCLVSIFSSILQLESSEINEGSGT